MAPANLTEKLFKPSFKYPETSTLIRRVRQHTEADIHSTMDGDTRVGWYRMINRLMWLWRGMDPIEIEEVLSRIAVSTAEHSNPAKLDTVIGYRRGNWNYEWSHEGMLWQQRAQEAQDPLKASEYWLMAANFYSVACYPHLKGDTLADQAEVLANKAYEQSAKTSPYQLKELEFAMPSGAPVTGFLHMPTIGSAPYPTVMLCGSLDALQSDYHRLFLDYLAPLGLAMLTVDMPSIGFSSRRKLTQDTSSIHQQVLTQLGNIPWIDHQRVGLFGFRFGANVAVRLGYLESNRVKAVACLGPIVHTLLCDSKRQQQVPDMYMDVFASRLGMTNASDSALKVELNRYSLKMQGLLGRRCSTPMLSAYWENDPFSPAEESRLITNSSNDGKLLELTAKPAHNSFERGLKDICNWLHEKMC